jgi:pSer/pThr/pTyr-binding forkhead associated (FHA) protein
MAFGIIAIQSPDHPIVNIELAETEMTTGRGADNHIVLADSQASRRHAKFICDDTGVRIVDLGSANGTFVNDNRLRPNQPVQLNDGDHIRIGQTLLIFSRKPGGVRKKVEPEPPGGFELAVGGDVIRGAPSEPQAAVGPISPWGNGND